MKISHFLFLSIWMVFCSCDNQSPEEKILNEAIEIHDAVMPEMQTIFLLRKELSIKKDSLEVNNGNPALITDVSLRINELSDANEDMMQWMREFNKDFEGDENISRLEYLQLEREKIEDVNIGFDLAIQNAKVTLSNFK